MTEHEYVVVSSLHRLRAAEALIGEAISPDTIKGMEQRRGQALKAIAAMISGLEDEVDRLMEGEPDA